MTEKRVEEYLKYVKETKSANTYKEYRHGINAFAEWYSKTPEEILEERRQDWVSGDLHQKKRFKRELEKFHAWLRQPIHAIKGKPDQAYSINSARTMCLGIQQLFKFYEMPVVLDTGSSVTRTVLSTKDIVPTPQQYRDMYKVADSLRDKLIISAGKDLAWRIGDFIKQRKDQLPNLEGDAPIPYDLITEKEDVLAKSFLSAETVELLKEYLPTTPKDNPYLFASNNDKHIDDETVNRALRALAEKANIKIPENKRLRFHSFRKRFLSTCADLSVDVNIAKILCGKDVEKDMLTYLSEVEHRKAFLRVHEVLNLTGAAMRKTAKPTTQLEKELEDLKRLVHGLIALGGRDLVEKAKELAQLETLPYSAQELSEAISEIGEKELRRQREEYRRLIESVNHENNNEK